MKQKNNISVESMLEKISKVEDYIIDINDPLVRAILIGINNDKSVLIQGPKGTGKTSMISHIAEALGRKVEFIQMTGTTTVEDFAGEKGIRDGSTFIEKKTLQECMEKGYICIADELNLPIPDVLAILYSVLDERKTLMLPGNIGDGNTTVKAHPDFRFFATINPSDEGDYMGTKKMSEALIDRFKIVVRSQYPTVEKEKRILEVTKSVVINNKTPTYSKNVKVESEFGILEKICKVASEIRESKDISYVISTRNLIDWAELCSIVGIIEAYKLSFSEKIDSDDKEAVEGIIAKYFKENETCKILK